MKKKELMDILKILDKRVRKIYDIKIKYDINIDLESSNTIGRFTNRNSKNSIHFNKKVFKNSPTKKFIEVIVHEYSHMVVYNMYGRVKSHGTQWKSVMRSLGQNNPTPTTNVFKYIKKKDSEVMIKCGCGKRYISANRATRMKNGTKYVCRSCSKKLEFI